MSDPFIAYVQGWDELCADIAKLEKKLKPLKAKELEMRKALAESVKAALGADLKEGVNRYALPDGRTLKLTNGIKREIETAEIANAREAYGKQNDQPVTFDQILRLKYELSKRDFDKLPDAAKHAISRMIVAKPETPKLEIE